MIYACADIHGRKDKFDRLLGKISLQRDDKLIIIGDVIDRGPDGIILLQEMMANPQFLLMLGNHEYMMLNAVEHSKDFMAIRRWYNNGGQVTHQAFLELSEDKQNEIIRYLQSLPVNLSVKASGREYLLVHGSPMSCFSRNDVKYLDAIEYSVWERIQVNMDVPDHQTIVFGHTPTNRYRGSDLPMKIWHGKGLIGIDCGCAFAEYGGQLGCICLDTLEEYYSDIDDEKEELRDEG